MESTTLRWKATRVVLPGFLLMTCLISGVSALKCQYSTSIKHLNSEGNTFGIETASSNISCSADENTCLDVQLKLSTDGTAVLVSHRGCARKDLNNTEGSSTIGDQNFAIQSNFSYCLSDLCNAEMASGNALKTPEKGTAPEATGSFKCYSGLNLDLSEPFLERVRCNKGYNRCYQGEAMITVAFFNIPLYLRTCQRPSCAVPQSQSFGPITITSNGGACCAGSFCNAKAVASQSQNSDVSVPVNGSDGKGAVNHTTNFAEPDVDDGTSSTSPVPGTSSVTPGRSWETIPHTTAPDPYDDYETTDHSDGNDEPEDTDSPTSLIIPRARGSGPKGPALQCCPLLVALGITALGIWW